MNSLSGIPSRGVPSQHEAPRSFLVFDSFIRWSLQWIRFHPTWGILTDGSVERILQGTRRIPQ